MKFSCDPSAIIPIVIIYFALFFDFFLLEGFVIVHPKLSKAHNWDSDDLTPILSVCKFAMMITCPIVAYASTRLAAHNILIIGIGFLALSALGLAFSNSFIMFAASKVAHGIASPSLTLSSMSILTYLAEETTRGQYASYGYAAISHGLLVAPFLTGIMVERLGQFWAYMIIFTIIASNLTWSIAHFHGFAFLQCFRRKSVVAPVEETKAVDELSLPSDASRKDIKRFEPITTAQIRSLLLTLLRNPYMLTAVTSCFLVGLSIGANESVLLVILDDLEEEMGLTEMQGTLIWTGGSISYMIFATLTGLFADRIKPVKLVIGGMTAFIITYATMPQVCSSFVGLISHITTTGALTSFLDVAAYPLIASVVDTAAIPNAYIIGYSIEYCLEQLGYAIGQYAGSPLFKLTDSMEPVAYMVAGADTLLLCFSLFCLFVYPANRFVVEPKDEQPAVDDSDAVPEML